MVFFMVTADIPSELLNWCHISNAYPFISKTLPFVDSVRYKLNSKIPS